MNEELDKLKDKIKELFRIDVREDQLIVECRACRRTIYVNSPLSLAGEIIDHIARNPTSLGWHLKRLASKIEKRRTHQMKREEVIAILEKILSKIDLDPKTRELAEEYQRKYGTLTVEDLEKILRG